MHQLDNFYGEFSEQWEFDCLESMKRKKKSTATAKETIREESASNRNFINYTQRKVEKNRQEEKKTESRHEGLKRDPYFRRENGGNVLAQKMKELEMMDLHDLDHVLDIEEVLHHYSCLTSPVYIDLVNTFFSDMYSEFLLPQPSVTIDTFKRRLGPLKL